MKPMCPFLKRGFMGRQPKCMGKNCALHVKGKCVLVALIEKEINHDREIHQK